MVRFLFRLLAMVALAVAVIMGVLDATRTIAVSQPVITPLGVSWAAVSPDTLAAVQDAVMRNLHPAVWDPGLVWVLSLPGFAVFLVLALIFYAIGRRPARRIGRFAVES